MKENNKKGFTLIELLVVVLIIGILASVALPQYQKAVTKTKVMRLLPLLRSIDNAQAVYLMANGTYATDFNDLDIGMPAGAVSSSANSITYNNFSCWFQVGTVGSLSTYSAYCSDSDSKSPNMEKYFQSDSFLCWDKGNSFAESVCKSISGKTTSDGTGTGGTQKYYSVK